jgi:hypothetical protein
MCVCVCCVCCVCVRACVWNMEVTQNGHLEDPRTGLYERATIYTLVITLFTKNYIFSCKCMCKPKHYSMARLLIHFDSLTATDFDVLLNTTLQKVSLTGFFHIRNDIKYNPPKTTINPLYRIISYPTQNTVCFHYKGQSVNEPFANIGYSL